MATTGITIEQAIARAYQIQKTHPTYSMKAGERLGPTSYDCSGFVGTCWGIPGFGTISMESEYPRYGFIKLPYTFFNAIRGDVLVFHAPNPKEYGAPGHTGIYLGNGQTIEMTTASVIVRSVTEVPWQTILRDSLSGIYIAHWKPTDDIDDGF